MFSAKLSIANYCATSEGVGISAIHPEKNSVTLENGSSIEYNQLVLTYGTRA